MAGVAQAVRSSMWPGVLVASLILTGGCRDQNGSPGAAGPAPTNAGVPQKPVGGPPPTPGRAPSADVSPAGNRLTSVKIAGQEYRLEVADTDDVRYRGLGGRTEIAEDGGMIFVFPPRYVGVHSFVMRDCPIDIDIIYTDGRGKVLAAHEMKAEPARDPAKGEGKPGDKENAAYEGRLKRYSSYYPATFAIELKAGSIRKLGVKAGDVLEFDHQGLKKSAR